LLGGTLTVANSNAASLTGTLTVAGATTINNTLNVTNISTLAVTTIAGGLVVTGGSLRVSGGTALGGSLNVIGASTLSNTIVSDASLRVSGLWVVVGTTTTSGTGNTIATSSDGGSTWTGRGASIFSSSGNGVAWNGSLWVAGGTGGNTIATSTDGINWTGRGATILSNSCQGVAWSPSLSLWVVVGGTGGNTIATSTDGITWTGRGASTFTNYGQAVAWNGLRFVAVGSGGNTIATSTDGIAWSAVTITGGGLGTAGYGIAWSSSLSLWVGVGGSNGGVTSSNGTSWTSNSVAITSTVKGVAWSPSLSLFVAVGIGPGTTISYSANGTSWTSIGASTFTTSGNGVAWNGSMFVATGQGGNTIATSSNGVAWIARTGTLAPFNSYGNGAFGTPNDTTLSGPLAVTQQLDVGGGLLINQTELNTVAVPAISLVSNAIAPYEIAARTVSGGDGFLRLRAGFNGGPGVASHVSYIDIIGFKQAAADDRQIRFGTNCTERMRIMANGNVGINTTTPSTALQVNGTVTALTFNANSDKRIKQNITDISGSSLELLRKLKPREYTIIDTNEERYGFVAQEVRQHIPRSVKLSTNFIPSIYENAFVDGNKITLINKSTTDVSCCKLKLRNNTGGEVNVNVTKIHDNKTFTIDTDISSNIFCMDTYGNKLDKHANNGTTTYMLGSQIYTSEVKEGIFVYGIEIDDFHNINHDTIWTIAAGATQELDSQLQEARQTIRTLEERIAAIERRFS
jgi:hypothetical protein